MKRTNHLLLPVVTAAMLLAACGGSASDSTTTTAGAVTTTAPVTSTSPDATTSTSGASTSAPATTVLSTTSSTTTTSTTVTTTEDPASRVTVIAVEWANGELVGGQEEYEVDRDAVVEIIVTADVTEEIHVHGYDVFVDVAPGEPGSVTFRASIPGIFEVEFEGSGRLLFDLVVS